MSGPVHVGSDDILANPKWVTQNSGWGAHRATHAGAASAGLGASLVRMPGGQRSPWHGAGGWPDLDQPFPALGDGGVFLSVAGEVAFGALHQQFVMEPYDMLVTNAAVYCYFNPGTVDNLFWTVSSKRRLPTGPDDVVWKGDPLAADMPGGRPYYDEEPEHDVAPDAADRFRLIPWRDYRLQPITWFGEWGSHWGAYPWVEAGARARVVRIPPAQRTVARTADDDTLFIGLEGDRPLELDVDGARVDITALNSAVVPEGASFTFANGGGREALVFEAEPSVRR